MPPRSSLIVLIEVNGQKPIDLLTSLELMRLADKAKQKATQAANQNVSQGLSDA